jgi:hypothetical protein
MLDATPYLQALRREAHRDERGRAFFTTPETLGDYVLVDFIEHGQAQKEFKAGIDDDEGDNRSDSST